MEIEKPFILSCKAIIFNSKGECLILRRSMSSKFNKAKWDLPGGKVDKFEAFDQALLREIKEETNLDISIEKALTASSKITFDAHVVYLIIAAKAKNYTVTLSSEHDEYAWVNSATISGYAILEQFNVIKEFLT